MASHKSLLSIITLIPLYFGLSHLTILASVLNGNLCRNQQRAPLITLENYRIGEVLQRNVRPAFDTLKVASIRQLEFRCETFALIQHIFLGLICIFSRISIQRMTAVARLTNGSITLNKN